MSIKSIYINVPFCKKICSFCNFYKNPSDLLQKSFTPQNPYYQFLLTELSLYQSLLSRDILSIYVGGGSPLELPKWQLVSFLNFLSENFSLEQAEKTIESNPNILDIPEEYVKFFNRISVGIQSFFPKFRKILGRSHSPNKDFLQTVKNIFKKVSVDMIWDIPNQTLYDLEQDIYEVIDNNFEHVSWYALEDPSEEVLKGSLQRYQSIQKGLLKNGLSMYEISNYSKEGHQSIHNLAYWEHHYYVGLGPGACGFIPTKNGPLRYTNQFSVSKYLSAIQERRFPYIQSEILQEKQICNEKILLGLRLEKGVDILDIQQKYDVELLSVKSNVIKKYRNYMQIVDQRYIKLTLEGKLFYNTICSELLL